MNILPPFEIYVDEANTPLFEARPGLCTPYAVAAVAMSPLDKDKIIAILPRDDSGNLLKSSSVSMTDELAANFIRNLLALNVLVALVGVDASDPENCGLADVMISKANEIRRKKLTKSNMMYVRTVVQALANIWSTDKITFFDLILDSSSLPKKESRRFCSVLQEKLGSRGTTVREIRWQTEQVEPLLLAPDILAGVGSRWSTHQDVPASWNEIVRGHSAGKLIIENGFEVYTAC